MITFFSCGSACVLLVHQWGLALDFKQCSKTRMFCLFGLVVKNMLEYSWMKKNKKKQDMRLLKPSADKKRDEFQSL